MNARLVFNVPYHMNALPGFVYKYRPQCGISCNVGVSSVIPNCLLLLWSHNICIILLLQVQVELELRSRTLNLTVTPTQATIIYHFQDKIRWSVDDLSTVTQVPKTVLRRKITYWQTQVRNQRIFSCTDIQQTHQSNTFG